MDTRGEIIPAAISAIILTDREESPLAYAHMPVTMIALLKKGAAKLG
jgi:hypothetical protein